MSEMHSRSAAEVESIFNLSLARLETQARAANLSFTMAVAYSGGLDSSVLLALATRYCEQRQIPLFAYYIHHGLSPFASDWETHCRAQCELTGVRFRSLSVVVVNDGQGIESAARQQRYRALGELAQSDGVTHLLTAHHLDDQAETMLMQLFRGTGLRGLAGMDETNWAPRLLHCDGVAIARPLLACSKAQLLDFASRFDLKFVQDESNQDTALTRNALRYRVMPQIEAIFPQFSERLMRTAAHVRASISLLDEIAQNDERLCCECGGILVAPAMALSLDRRRNLFRFRLQQAGLALPSTAKLEEMTSQLFFARQDARVQIEHDGHLLSRYDGRIEILPLHRTQGELADLLMHWQGEPEMAIPELHGRLRFEESASGVSAAWLMQKTLCIRTRQPGLRLRLASNRPSRDMKSHFQSLRIPFWAREKLPYIFVEDRLFFVGLLGMDAAFICHEDVERKVTLQWLPD